MASRYSWGKYTADDGKTERWGIKVAANLGEATGQSGREVQVTNRAGKTSTVRLGRQVYQWNGGRAAIYAVSR